MSGLSFAEKIKEKALRLGFDQCGICRAEAVEDEERYMQWLAAGHNAGMTYLERNIDKRFDVRKLVPGAKSIICTALNYYPAEKLSPEVPQFAYYAYGQDYHRIIKNKLFQLLAFIRGFYPMAKARCFTDSAPVLESYWAVKAGIGFIGKNTLLVIPGKGSYFLLGEMIIDLELDYDKPCNVSCGRCRRCIDNCPTGALKEDDGLDARHCISYQTIENKEEDIPEDVVSKLCNNLFGCDICQKVCPWNRFVKPSTLPELMPKRDFLSLNENKLSAMEEVEFDRLFDKSPVQRAGFKGLRRNMKALKKSKF